MSGSRSQQRGVTNHVWFWRRDMWGSWLEGLLKTRVISWTGSISRSRSSETTIFLEVGLVMSGSISQLRGVAYSVCVQRHDVWKSRLEGFAEDSSYCRDMIKFRIQISRDRNLLGSRLGYVRFDITNGESDKPRLRSKAWYVRVKIGIFSEDLSNCLGRIKIRS